MYCIVYHSTFWVTDEISWVTFATNSFTKSSLRKHIIQTHATLCIYIKRKQSLIKRVEMTVFRWKYTRQVRPIPVDKKMLMIKRNKKFIAHFSIRRSRSDSSNKLNQSQQSTREDRKRQDKCAQSKLTLPHYMESV